MASQQRSKLLPVPDNVYSDIKRIHNMDKPGRLEDAINILENWLQKQDHILKKDYDKIYYEKTILSCKGSVEKAKKQIDRLATMRTLLPNFFSPANFNEEFTKHFDQTLLVPLPIITEDFYRVVVIKLYSKIFNSNDIMSYYRFTMYIAEYLKLYDYVDGFIIIFDFLDLNIMDVVLRANFVELQHFATILIEGYGCRVKGLYCLSESKAIDILFKTIKQFLSDKIGKRLKAISSIEEIHKIVPKEILPVEYGGPIKSLYKLWDEWTEELGSPKHQKHMEIMNKAVTDENLRTKCKFNEDYLGMPGSFQKLNVD